MSKLKDAIRAINTNSFEENYAIPCTVVSVDEVALTCVCAPVNGDSDILDVRLQAGEGNGVVIIPAVDSVVMVTMINSMTGYVGMVSQVDSIQLLDGSFGGLIKIDEIVTKLNNLESDINDLKTAFSSWVVVPSDGGAALKAITATWFGSSLTPTVKGDLENDLITHGDK